MTMSKFDANEFAGRINDHLAAGGKVMVGTHLRSTIYGPKHAGWFSADAKGDLRVRRGRGTDCIGFAKTGLLVAVRFSKEVA
jgi:hypothetical protein